MYSLSFAFQEVCPADSFASSNKTAMPQVHIRITQEQNSAAQKAALIAGTTRLLSEVLGKNPETTLVTIEELLMENWGIGGQPVTERRLADVEAKFPRIEAEPITGSEPHDGLDTPLDALRSFYCAFNHQNLPLMREVWLSGNEPSMDNPIGGIRRGWEEIEQGYHKLFHGSAKVEVEFHDYTLQVHGDFATAVGRERGTCTVGDQSLTLAIRTSRIFVRRAGQWKQLHHHGSVEDPALLSQYQALIFSAAKTNH